MPIAQLNGTTLCSEETGHGEALVLVHGAWVDHTTWEQVVPRLSSSFRVVTYDLRGHGRSKLDPPEAGTVHDDIADLVALIEHLDLGPVNVAGISSGACIALPVAVSSAAKVIAEDAGATIVWTKLSAAHLMEVAGSGDVDFAASQEGGFIWPSFLPAYDAAATLVHLLDLLAAVNRPLSALVAEVPEPHVAHEAVERR